MDISDILWSLWYNRDVSELIDLCDELIGRIDNTFPCDKWTDDGNILYGAMIHAYGNYGTSPRAGWFEDLEAVRDCKDQIEEFRADMVSVKERGDD